MRAVPSWLLLIVCCFGSIICVSEELTIAAAADLQFLLPELTHQFEQQTGNTVKVIFGSSGTFSQQIQSGAPFDIFFSADISYPKGLEATGLIEPGTMYHYADGRIVLWKLKTAKFPISRGMIALLDPGVRKVAIANPEHAPYGRAAVAALQREKLYDRVKGKLVTGENISEAAQFVYSGNAEVGIIALSLALAPTMQERGTYALVPDGQYPAIQQACVILKSSHHKTVAQQFLAFVEKPEAAALFKRYGFAVPSTTH